jgi:hypothetical protein
MIWGSDDKTAESCPVSAVDSGGRVKLSLQDAVFRRSHLPFWWRGRLRRYVWLHLRPRLVSRIRGPLSDASIDEKAKAMMASYESALRAYGTDFGPAEQVKQYVHDAERASRRFAEDPRRVEDRDEAAISARAAELVREQRRLHRRTRVSPPRWSSRSVARPLLAPKPTRRESRPGRRVRATASAGGDDPPDEADRSDVELGRALRGLLGLVVRGSAGR